jgi:DNA gyrase subunit A
MHDLGIRANSPFRKSARIVGEVLGKYHPHGDSAVYDAMARMAQDFSMRYLLVDGQGNFGSIDGDAPAAMRYTEARLARMAEDMLVDIEQNTVDFNDNFDGSLQEPSVLPSLIPNLLLNGSSGIAVGMATNIPPHNLKELVAALTFMIDRYDEVDEVSVEELLKLIPGPDFPTGGVIVGDEEMRGGRHRIVITEIPYQLNKTTLIERIAELARSGRLDDISDLRDESDRRGMSIIVELKRGAQPRKILNQLYKYTPLQSTYGAQLLALVDGEPRLLSLKRALRLFIEHRQDVITRRSQFQLDKARARAHILEGLLIALAHLDEVIETIRKSPDADTAKDRLMTQFSLSEKQAVAILDMQLRRLAALEQQKIEDEQRHVLDRIENLEDLLADPKKILALIKADLAEIVETYGDERRTRIAAEASEDFNEEDLVSDEAVLITITEQGYIKRMSAKAFKAQRRGGRGVTGHAMKEEDEMLILFPARTLDTILFFSDKGKVYSERAYQIPDAVRTGRGIPIVNILSIYPDETITAVLAVPKFDESAYCIMATRRGRIKRLPLSAFASVRPSGLIAINLHEGDELGWARLTDGDCEIIMVTEGGQALRFSEKQVRATGRTAAGVIGIRFKSEDQVASMEVVEPGGELLVVTSQGHGKRTPLDQYSKKSRGTLGVTTINKAALKNIGKIVAARVVQEADDLTIISTNGVALRTKVKQISQAGRPTRGVRLIGLQEGDSVASLARIAESDLRQVGASQAEENKE